MIASPPARHACFCVFMNRALARAYILILLRRVRRSRPDGGRRLLLSMYVPLNNASNPTTQRPVELTHAVACACLLSFTLQKRLLLLRRHWRDEPRVPHQENPSFSPHNLRERGQDKTDKESNLL